MFLTRAAHSHSWIDIKTNAVRETSPWTPPCETKKIMSKSEGDTKVKEDLRKKGKVSLSI